MIAPLCVNGYPFLRLGLVEREREREAEREERERKSERERMRKKKDAKNLKWKSLSSPGNIFFVSPFSPCVSPHSLSLSVSSKTLSPNKETSKEKQ